MVYDIVANEGKGRSDQHSRNPYEKQIGATKIRREDHEELIVKGHSPHHRRLSGHRSCLCRPSRKTGTRPHSRRTQRGATQSTGWEPLKRERTAYYFHRGGPQQRDGSREIGNKTKGRSEHHHARQ